MGAEAQEEQDLTRRISTTATTATTSHTPQLVRTRREVSSLAAGVVVVALGNITPTRTAPRGTTPRLAAGPPPAPGLGAPPWSATARR